MVALAFAFVSLASGTRNEPAPALIVRAQWRWTTQLVPGDQPTSEFKLELYESPITFAGVRTRRHPPSGALPCAYHRPTSVDAGAYSVDAGA